MDNSDDIDSTAKCPDQRALALFLERRLPASDSAGIAFHAMRCPRCRTELREAAEWLAALAAPDGWENAPPEARAAAEKALAVVAERRRAEAWRTIALLFQPSRTTLAAATGETDDLSQREAAARAGFLHFVSRTGEGDAAGWHVKLAIPSHVTDETILRLFALDASELPVDNGTLTFCGVALPVRDGRATIPVTTFREHVGNAMISLRRPDTGDVPGEPVLGYGM